MYSEAELRAQAEKKYSEFLRSIVTGTPFFPLPVRLGKAQRAATYAEYRAEDQALRQATTALGLHVVWRVVRDPSFGSHERPESACFQAEPEYLRAIGKTTEVAAFRANLDLIRREVPALEAWLAPHVRDIVAHALHWPALLRVVCWFQAQPRCGWYLRQLPILGIDTKFIETHRAVLDDLITTVQPEHVTLTASTFGERHGLRREEPLVRLRFLDPALQAAQRFPVVEVAVPAPDFRQLPMAGVRVIITENLRNFLALLPLPGAVAVFGGGGAVRLLGGSPWLAESELFYWGDIDGHGFRILSQLRTLYPHVQSLMMDAATHQAGAAFQGSGAPWLEKPAALTPAETALWAEVCHGAGCLEQERVPFAFVLAQLRQTFGAMDT